MNRSAGGVNHFEQGQESALFENIMYCPVHAVSGGPEQSQLVAVDGEQPQAVQLQQQRHLQQQKQQLQAQLVLQQQLQHELQQQLQLQQEHQQLQQQLKAHQVQMQLQQQDLQVRHVSLALVGEVVKGVK